MKASLFEAPLKFLRTGRDPLREIDIAIVGGDVEASHRRNVDGRAVFRSNSCCKGGEFAIQGIGRSDAAKTSTFSVGGEGGVAMFASYRTL